MASCLCMLAISSANRSMDFWMYPSILANSQATKIILIVIYTDKYPESVQQKAFK